MAATPFFSRFRFRRTPQELAAIVADMTPVEPPAKQEVIDQLDADVVLQLQRMLSAENDLN